MAPLKRFAGVVVVGDAGPDSPSRRDVSGETLAVQWHVEQTTDGRMWPRLRLTGISQGKCTHSDCDARKSKLKPSRKRYAPSESRSERAVATPQSHSKHIEKLLPMLDAPAQSVPSPG